MRDEFENFNKLTTEWTSFSLSEHSQNWCASVMRADDRPPLGITYTDDDRDAYVTIDINLHVVAWAKTRAEALAGCVDTADRADDLIAAARPDKGEEG